MADSNISQTESAHFFQLAIDQNSMLKMYFLIDKCQFSILSAPCVMLKSGHFVVRASLEVVENAPIIWGTEVNGYFNVRDADTIHCHFSTRLVRIYNGSANSLYLVFPLPLSIDHNQRRFSKRININEETPGEFTVWFGNMDSGTLKDKPQLNWQSLADTACELSEISSSGLRLDIPENIPLCTKMSVNDLILLKGEFGSIKKPNSLYILGRIVRKMPNLEVEGLISLGCQFYAWQKILDTARSAWFKPDPRDGIGIISEWISRNFRGLNV